jgi:glycosyltransferase involved in cell wall biosynthesis
MPTISVVIPTYNRKASLKVTLDGLARQTHPVDDFEVVVVSDGSTDGTDAFLEEYARTSLYALRPITQENGGPARARNRGVQEALGRIIVFIDDDVEPISEFLAAHMAHHAQDEKVVVIGPMSPDPERRRAEPPWIAWEHAMLQKQYTNLVTGVWKSAGPQHFYTGNASLLREHLTAVGGFDVNFKRQEDVELAHRMRRERGVRFVFDPKADGVHRPFRTFDSWLNVAASYGQLDVVRARAGDVDWNVVRKSYHGRSLPTRLIASVVMTAPPLGPMIRSLLRSGAAMAYRAGRAGPAIGALSIIYNVRYLESAQQELGAKPMRRLLSPHAQP